MHMTVAAAAEQHAGRHLAPMIRDRRETRVNVVSAVCCDHSEVTSKMPSTGSRIATSWLVSLRT
jgi:hypothetical protein